MLKKILLISLGLFLVLLVTKTHVSPVSEQVIHAAEEPVSLSLEQELNFLLANEPALDGALAGISIRSAVTGDIIYNHMGNIRMRPASSLKLLTAATALSVLGKDYRFTTEVLIDVDGNLYLRGNGDPTLLVSDLEKLAQNLKEKGIKTIKGDLIGDDTWYDDVRYSPDLMWSDEHTYYGSQVSALTVAPNKDYDAGSIIVDISPGSKIGDAARLAVIPKTNYVKIDNQVKTVAKEGPSEITLTREHGTNNVLIEGTIPINVKKVRDWVSVWEPTRFALDLFKDSLKEKGIKLRGEVKTGVTPGKAKLLVNKSSMPLSELLIPFLKLSNNGHAEVLVKEMGKVVQGEGSWEKGLEVLLNELPKFKVNTDTLVVRDGSGVSHVDLVPANELTMLLFEVQHESWFPAYLKALPVAGNSDRYVGGTLRYRMKDELTKGKVRAKTGTLTTVTSLSGFVETKSGEKLIVSIILNNLLDEDEGKKIEDKIIKIIAKQ